jgi:hemerythrin-like metal-binding protein
MTEAPALGDPTPDADHAKLADLVDRLAAAKGADVLASLDALQAHASEHFALEDQELRQMRDGNASCHLDEHAAVLKSMDEVRGIVAAGPDSTESAHLVARLTAESRRWLPEHVTAMDAARRAYPHPQSPVGRRWCSLAGLRLRADRRHLTTHT